MEESGTADAAYRVLGAQSMIRHRFSKLDAHNNKMIRFAEEYGYVETVPDKNVDPDRGYPIVCHRDQYGRIKPTLPLNYRTQSTAMWCTSNAMIRISDYFDELNKKRWGKETLQILADPVLSQDPSVGYFLMLQVHDEAIIDIPAGGKRNLPVVNEVERLMKLSGDDIGIPLRVSSSYHPSSWSKEINIEQVL
jgi:DNA polymerase I-like protein with 3'-5' exonuclease and polymerase domains